MKGLHHSVIEIKDTQHSEIEKILVFLSPGRNKIDVDSATQDARDILQKVKFRHRLAGRISYIWVGLLLSAIITGFMALLFVIF